MSIFQTDKTILTSVAALIWIEVVRVFANLTPIVGLLIQIVIGTLTAIYIVSKIRYIRKLNKTTFDHEKTNQDPDPADRADV